MNDAELKASFEEGDFRSTVKLELSAELELEDGTLKVKGQISRGMFKMQLDRQLLTYLDDNFLEPGVGDLTLTDIKKMHARISGQKLPEKETKKPDDEKKED